MRSRLTMLAGAVALVVSGGGAVAAGAAAPASGSLQGVSCVSSTFCVAVGHGGQQPISLVWNGSTWSRVAPVTPAGNYAELDAVSCLSSTRCVAVGYTQTYTPSYLLRPMIQVFDGTGWTTATAPRLGTDSRLTSVSCPAANFCAAVGVSIGSDAFRHAFVEQWNGTAWHIVPSTPLGPESYLQGVSCTATRACTAVGFGSSHSGGVRTMVEERDAGGQWTLVASPNRVSGDQLYSVDCVAAHACVSAGTLVSARDADGWTRQRTPFDSKSYVDYGVSCVSVSACEIVGGPGPVAMQWDGARWRERATAPLADNANLYAVDCVAADSCIAVGGMDQGGMFPYPTPVAEQWNGTSWTQLTTP